MSLQCEIVSADTEHGRTAYTIKVTQGREEQFVKMHYNDFLVLDQDTAVQQLPEDSRPRLPPKGCVGLRHRLNLFGFNSRRKQGLQAYLNELLKTHAVEAPTLDQFLSLSPTPSAGGNMGEVADATSRAPPPPAPSNPPASARQNCIAGQTQSPEASAGASTQGLQGTLDSPEVIGEGSRVPADPSILSQAVQPFALRPSVGSWLQSRPPSLEQRGEGESAAIADVAEASADERQHSSATPPRKTTATAELLDSSSSGRADSASPGRLVDKAWRDKNRWPAVRRMASSVLSTE